MGADISVSIFIILGTYPALNIEMDGVNIAVIAVNRPSDHVYSMETIVYNRERGRVSYSSIPQCSKP